MFCYINMASNPLLGGWRLFNLIRYREERAKRIVAIPQQISVLPSA